MSGFLSQVRKLLYKLLGGMVLSINVFLGAFIFLVAVAGYLGLTSLQTDVYIDDKALHALTFFILSTVFYWILDTTRRRNLNFTLFVCTGVLAIGSEVIQHLLPNGRKFDIYDVVANIVGSLAAIALSSWYHIRMLERKRQAKQYQVVPTDEDVDLELGEGVGAQTNGVEITKPARSLDEEVDNWDENLEDNWDDDDGQTNGVVDTPSASRAGDDDTKKRGV